MKLSDIGTRNVSHYLVRHLARPVPAFVRFQAVDVLARRGLECLQERARGWLGVRVALVDGLLGCFLDFVHRGVHFALRLVEEVTRLVDRGVPLVCAVRQQVLQFVQQTHQPNPSSVRFPD